MYRGFWWEWDFFYQSYFDYWIKERSIQNWKELNQVEEYIDSIYKGNKLNSSPKIKAFVLGDSIDAAISKKRTQEDYGELVAYTYSQLVQTAEKRLFGLKTKLEEHYNQFNSEDNVNVILNEPEQLQLD